MNESTVNSLISNNLTSEVTDMVMVKEMTVTTKITGFQSTSEIVTTSKPKVFSLLQDLASTTENSYVTDTTSSLQHLFTNSTDTNNNLTTMTTETLTTKPDEILNDLSNKDMSRFILDRLTTLINMTSPHSHGDVAGAPDAGQGQWPSWLLFGILITFCVLICVLCVVLKLCGTGYHNIRYSGYKVIDSSAADNDRYRCQFTGDTESRGGIGSYEQIYQSQMFQNGLARVGPGLDEDYENTFVGISIPLLQDNTKV